MEKSEAGLKTLDREILIQKIQEKRERLKKTARDLKTHFVGLDEIIDKIISNLETWYVMPELMTRPVIICLFGPTGVGKTDLVRRLVKSLDFSDRYCEIELTTKSILRSISSSLKQTSNIESGKPNIILLDEVQSFRTIDEEGHDIHNYDNKDIWSLLSDGKLPYKVEVEALMGMLWDYNKQELIAKSKASDPPKMKKCKGGEDSEDDGEEGLNDLEIDTEAPRGDSRFNFYSLNYFKSVLRLNESIEEIALWPDAKKKQVIIQRLMDKSVYEEEDYTKSLIFISGNLDEAYGFTTNAKEVDIDADILHEMSKKISILDIKEALGKRFRPEQISRMGNVHVIYPSLSKASYEIIIERRIESIIKRVKEQTGIDLRITKSINQLIYDNGVFPTQGTRPVFSTISEILETALPEFLLKALINNNNWIEIDYREKDIIAFSCGEMQRIRYDGSLDRLKESHQKNLNRKALSAVHEAAHAIIHAILFKMSPNQIVATPISEDMEGFVYSQETCQSKEMLKNRICVLLAGNEAEKLVFGEDNKTSGCSDDLRKATGIAASMIRKWSMSTFSSHITHADKYSDANNNTVETNAIIENLIRESSNRTRELLSTNKNLLIEVIDNLIKTDKLSPEEFKAICSKNGVEIEISKSTEDIIYWDFLEKLEDFKGNRS